MTIHRLYLIHHSHTDIGYTASQAVIGRQQAEFIAQALDCCTATDALPAGERFAWTCEAAWAVKLFLRRFPERAAEFWRRVREGRIEVTALECQLTDLFTLELLEETLAFTTGEARRHGAEVVTAMQNDVNGWAWGLADLLARHGVRYFTTGINETRALGVRPCPDAFRWTGPQGGNLLTWHGLHYLTGNSLNLDTPDAERRVAAWLAERKKNGYAHPVIAANIHGENHDNAPPGLWICEAVRQWNAAHADLKLELCTPRTWFAALERECPQPFPERRLAWPDWWADGNGSALREVIWVRQAQADWTATGAAARAAGQTPDPERAATVVEQATLFCEHTWGAWNSTDTPDSLEAQGQWHVKAGFACTAAAESAALLADTLRAACPFPTPAAGVAEVAVFNPLPFPRSDLAEVTIPDWALTGGDRERQVLTKTPERPGPACHLEDTAGGAPIPVRREPVILNSARHPGQRLRFIARDVPALGWKRYRLLPGDLPEAATSVQVRDHVLTTSAWRAALAPATGAITSLRQAGIDAELVNPQSWALGQLIHETIPAGRETLAAWPGVLRNAVIHRATPAMAAVAAEPHPLGITQEYASTGDGFPRVRTAVTAYAALPRLDLTVTVTPPPAADRTDAFYLAFPFAARRPEVYVELPGAVMRPGRDQIPGSATDWHSVQHYFAVADGAAWTAVVATPDAPLLQINGINTGLWQEQLPPPNGTVMSWLMNNYWFTNFPASQNGPVTCRFSLDVRPGGFDAATASRFALTIRQPLRTLARLP